MLLPHIEQTRNIFLPKDMSLPESRTLEDAGDNLGNIMAQDHAHGFLYRDHLHADHLLLGTIGIFGGKPSGWVLPEHYVI